MCDLKLLRFPESFRAKRGIPTSFTKPIQVRGFFVEFGIFADVTFWSTPPFKLV